MISFEEAVLVAIAKGANTVDSIASVLRARKSDVERALGELVAKGLVRVEEKGWWVFKRRVLALTRKGFEASNRAYEKLVDLASRIKEKLAAASWEEREALSGFESLVSGFGYLLPLLLWMELIDFALLTPLAITSFGQEYGDAEAEAEYDADVDYA